ncbi:MAG: DMT family transporter [SAR324 cluster bacterium]|nr:DMT family transporter [SAR324 cluster bacterium]
MGPIEWVLLGTLSILWGGSFFFQKIALRQLPPFTILLGRVGIAALALHALHKAGGGRMPRSVRTWGALLVMGALNNLVPFSLILWSQLQITSGLASILTATSPLFTTVLAHFLTGDERLTTNRIGGVLLGLGGVTVMLGPDVLLGFGLNLIAQLAVLAAAVSYACAGIFGRRFKELPPLVAAVGQLTASTLMILPLALAVDRPWSLPMPDVATWGALLGLALPSTAVGYIIYFRILASAGATNILMVTFLMPVVALLLGTAILNEGLDPGHLAGMALIALGLAAVDGRPFAPLTRYLARKPG